MRGLRASFWIGTALALAACTDAPEPGNQAGNETVAPAAKPSPAPEKITTRCALTGSSTEQDPRGLNVRAAPDAKAPVLGRLLSATDPESHHHPGPPEYYGPNFRIIDVKGDWVQITGADPLPDGIPEEDLPNYTGTGWVHASRVRVDVSPPGGAEYGPARKAPDERAEIVDPDGGLNSYQGGPTVKLIDCRGEWAFFEYPRLGYSGPEPEEKWVDYTPTERAKLPPVHGWIRSHAFRTGQTCESGTLKCRPDGSVNWNATFGYE